MTEGKARTAGEESRRRPLRSRRTRRSRPPVQIGPSKDAPGTAGPNRAGRRRRERSTMPTPQRGRQPPAPAPPRARPGPPPPAPDGPRQILSTPPAFGQTVPSRSPGLDSPTHEGRHARACPFSAKLPTASTRHIRDGRVEPACNGRINMAAPTDTKRPRREAGRSDPRSRRRRERSEATERTGEK